MPVHESLISLEQYLHTTYRPECEFVDGRVVERNAGMRDHSSAIGEVVCFFYLLEASPKFFPFPILRVQVSPTRIRVPDVSVCLGREPDEQILTTPPFLAVEVLAPEDLAAELLDKLDDYRQFGIPYVWIINPAAHSGATCSLKDGSYSIAPGLHTKDPDIDLPARRLFE